LITPITISEEQQPISSFSFFGTPLFYDLNAIFFYLKLVNFLFS